MKYNVLGSIDGETWTTITTQEHKSIIDTVRPDTYTHDLEIYETKEIDIDRDFNYIKIQNSDWSKSWIYLSEVAFKY